MLECNIKVYAMVHSSWVVAGMFPNKELAELFVKALKEKHIYGYVGYPLGT